MYEDVNLQLRTQQIVAAKVAFYVLDKKKEKSIYTIFPINHLPLLTKLNIYCHISEGCQTKQNAPLYMKDAARNYFVMISAERKGA